MEHVADSIWWHLVSRCEIEHFVVPGDALQRERELILGCKPRFNIQLSETRSQRLKAAQQAMKERLYQEQGVTPELRAKITRWARDLGRKGAQARWAKLAPVQRSEAARKAAQARWAEHSKQTLKKEKSA
jgi:hypothetical protein